MRSKGDADSADTWLRIIVAIGHAGRDTDRLWAYMPRSPVC
jgi:hypothetical protein